MNRFFYKKGSASVRHSITKFIIISVLAAVPLFSVSADTTHVVQKGETLYSISRLYHTTVGEICSLNKISDGASVKAGQKILIPSSGSDNEKSTGKNQTPKNGKENSSAQTEVYVVQKGDTWYGIARRNGVQVKELLSLNNSDSGADLKIGQKIKLPGTSPVSGSSVAFDSASSSAEASAKSEKKDSSYSKNISVPLPDISSSDPHKYSNKKGDSSLVWPVQTKSVTYVDGKVSGVKLAAEKNEKVTAIRAGTVMFSGSYRGFGNVVFIQSKTGHIYAYTGLGSVKVSKGDYIVFGDQIGTAGVDSYTEKPQMSLMVFQNGLPIDPAKAPRG